MRRKHQEILKVAQATENQGDPRDRAPLACGWAGLAAALHLESQREAERERRKFKLPRENKPSRRG
jgi:hypothetical protein